MSYTHSRNRLCVQRVRKTRCALFMNHLPKGMLCEIKFNSGDIFIMNTHARPHHVCLTVRAAGWLWNHTCNQEPLYPPFLIITPHSLPYKCACACVCGHLPASRPYWKTDVVFVLEVIRVALCEGISMFIRGLPTYALKFIMAQVLCIRFSRCVFLHRCMSVYVRVIACRNM